MKQKYIFLLYLMCAGILYAQPRFVPDVEIKKLGEVEFQQPKRVVFDFVNKGNQPLRISSAKASCGCMDVSFPKTAIPAGKRGEITLVYDAGMLGTFYKEIEVVSNASESPVYLGIQGTVVVGVRDVGEDYPIDLGNVQLQTNYLEFADVHKGEHPVLEMSLINKEHTAFRPELMHLPAYLSAQYIPENVPPGKKGVIRLTLDSDKLFQMGLNKTSVYLSRYMGDKISDANEIQISAVLLPDFSRMTAKEKENAPALYISESFLDFGSLEGKSKATHTISVYNQGKSDLHFEQVQVFSEAVSVSLGNRVLKPGASTKLKITVTPKYLKHAKGRPRVLLITNDPLQPKTIVNIDVKP
ncbi:MAG: DUF1573 domain-containing protein [Bacteroidaceae bacterium]|nr:DUF1573 domain-containing protein [Bacteroidaceae bacterium]